MDSPNASGYVPLSLVDTLTRPNRTYRSVQATPSSSSRTHHAHSASLSALASKERSEQARREAALMCESLGIGGGVPETPARGGGGGSFNSADVEATPKPQSSSHQQKEVSSLKVRLEDKDQEIQALRKELGVLVREKKDLGVRCERMEKESSGRSTVGQGGLDAKQVEELVKQFNDQEALLGGYQREAEKSLAELDRLRNRERRLSDWFERMYGPNWADELNLSDKPSLSSSPALRTKLSSRPSLLTTPSSSSLSSSSRLSPDTTPSLTSPSETSPFPPPLNSSNATQDPQALKQHLESVQSLIRGMETRMIARGVELEKVEKRAREESRRAESKRRELESIVEDLKVRGVTVST